MVYILYVHDVSVICLLELIPGSARTARILRELTFINSTIKLGSYWILKLIATHHFNRWLCCMLSSSILFLTNSNCLTMRKFCCSPVGQLAPINRWAVRRHFSGVNYGTQGGKYQLIHLLREVIDLIMAIHVHQWCNNRKIVTEVCGWGYGLWY